MIRSTNEIQIMKVYDTSKLNTSVIDLLLMN